MSTVQAASIRCKSPQIKRGVLRARHAPPVLKATMSTQPLPLSETKSQSETNRCITNLSNGNASRRNNAAYRNNSEKAAACTQEMKSARHGENVPVRNTTRKPQREQQAPQLVEVSTKNLMIAAPAKNAQCSPAQFEEVLAAEANDATQLQTVAPMMQNQAAFDRHRFYNQSNNFVAMMQAHRFELGASDIGTMPPTEMEFAAFEQNLKENDPLYESVRYFIDHRHNKPGVMNSNMLADFVEYGSNIDLIPKGKRRLATEVYSPQFIAEILDQFRKEGSNVLITAETLLKFAYKTGFHGRPESSSDYLHGDGELFNTESAAITEIYRIAGPGATGKALVEASKKVLALKEFAGEIVVHLSIPPLAIKNPRLASGNEQGATDEWRVGATTPYGHLEIISDRVSMAGIPGSDPNKTAPTVQLLGKYGEGVPVYPGNYREVGDWLIALLERLARRGLPEPV